MRLRISGHCRNSDTGFLSSGPAYCRGNPSARYFSEHIYYFLAIQYPLALFLVTASLASLKTTLLSLSVLKSSLSSTQGRTLILPQPTVKTASPYTVPGSKMSKKSKWSQSEVMKSNSGNFAYIVKDSLPLDLKFRDAMWKIGTQRK